MRSKGHMQEILLHLLLVLVLPLVVITAVAKAVEIAGSKPDWLDAVVLLLKTVVMVNVAIHPLPSKYNTAEGEPIVLFPGSALLGYMKPSGHDSDEYDEGEPIPEAESDTQSDASAPEQTDKVSETDEQ